MINIVGVATTLEDIMWMRRVDDVGTNIA